MADNARAADELRRDIATEREELVRALRDLRGGFQEARRIPALAGAALAAGLGLAAALTAVRRRRR